MKITCEWMVLAERVIEDSSNHTLTLVSCLEEIRTWVFPSQHHGFAVAARFRSQDGPPDKDHKLRMRLVRVSDHDPDEVIAEAETTWVAGLTTARWVMNFSVLRLKRPETLRFRIDHRLGRGGWQTGPSGSVDIVEVELTEQQRQKLLEELQARGLPTDGLVP